jgi:hypothetical protein
MKAGSVQAGPAFFICPGKVQLIPGLHYQLSIGKFSKNYIS